MNRKKIINALSSLGLFLSQFEYSDGKKKQLDLNKDFYREFDTLILDLKAYNGWFDEKHVRRSLGEISRLLTDDNLMDWSSRYIWCDHPKKIAVIMAGNLPLVGIHDYFSVLLSGHFLLVKMSSNDNILLPFIHRILVYIDSELKDRVEFSESKLKGFDAVIATGSNNSARYFSHYFSQLPNVIRKNRNSVAVLSGNESPDELKALADDVFSYYGLGCRNVSKVYVPMAYDFRLLFEAFYDYNYVTDNQKFSNNYDYYKAIYLMGGNEILDNGFLLLKEDASISSPISVLHYEFYSDESVLQKHIDENRPFIQCLVSNFLPGSIVFGQSQSPSLLDYADGVDTMQFLTGL